MYCMLELIHSLLYWLSIITFAFLAPFFIVVRIFFKKRTRKVFGRLWNYPSSTGAPVVVGFFHPYCNAGGGGERVLWCGIRALQRRYEFVHCVVYTGDLEASPEEITARAFERFNIELERPVSFIYLTKRRWVEADMWPYFTLLGQSLGSMLLGFEALWKFVPDVCIDTMGYAFTYPLFRFLGGCRVGCYVHYPTISTDMLTTVRDREETYNNAGVISKSLVLTQAKLLYYKLFAFTYGLVGKCSSVIMVNSSWTQNHVLEIWKKPECTTVVYPPCDTTEFSKLENSSEVINTKQIISIGQFRPEKNHMLQVRSFAKFLQRQKSTDKKKYKLLLVGSCRNAEDEQRVEHLMGLCGQLKISDFVEFHLNIPYSSLKELLSQSTIGIHTMWNEHFGIGVVEFMAAGVIALAHDSGGPQLDIVVPWKGQTTGFRASGEKSYAKSISNIFEMGPKKRDRMRNAARESVQEKFSEEIFENEFLKHTEILIR